MLRKLLLRSLDQFVSDLLVLDLFILDLFILDLFVLDLFILDPVCIRNTDTRAGRKS